MDIAKQKEIDICKINIEEDENIIRAANQVKYEELIAIAKADKAKYERKLAELTK